jgi:DNA invertase Pin-like site-specific DNA recombinase
MSIVIYYGRVSTRQQGADGLGLAAQKTRVEQFCASNGFKIFLSFEDVASGKDENRPELQRALARSKEMDIPIVVADLDRLSRRLGFICELLDNGARFFSADLGIAVDTMTIQILGAVGEANRKRIGERTKRALQEAKDRGVVLGNPNIAEARVKANQRRTELANERAMSVVIETLELMKAHAKERKRWGLKPVFQDGQLKTSFGWMCPSGTLTKEKVCLELTQKTARGKTYNVVGLNRAIARTAKLLFDSSRETVCGELVNFTSANAPMYTTGWSYSFSHTSASRELQHAEHEGNLVPRLTAIQEELRAILSQSQAPV